MPTPVPFALFQESLAEGRVDLRNDPVMFMICDSDFTPSQAAHKFRSIVNNEIVGSGYSPGGKQITGITMSYSGVTKKYSVFGGPLAWPSVTFTDAKWGVIYVAREGVPITSQPLMAYVDLGAVSRSDAPFYVTFPSTGLISWTMP